MAPTSGLDGVLVQDVDQLVLAAGPPVFGVVGPVVLQEGKVNPLLVLHGQRGDVLQEFVGHLEIQRSHPVGAQLHRALHPHEALVLGVQGEKRQRVQTPLRQTPCRCGLP